MKLLKIPWYLALAIVLWSSQTSCKKDPKPDCWDGSCCDQNKNIYQYITYLENAPADLGRFGTWGVVLKDGIRIGQNTPVVALPLCDYCVDKVLKLEPSYTKETATNPPLAYRIWGKILQDTVSTSFTGLPSLFIYIDRIEKVQ